MPPATGRGTGGGPGRGRGRGGPPAPPPEHEQAFQQANRSRSGVVSKGELYCHLCAECGQPPEVAAELFLIMDLKGDGKLDQEEWTVGYKKYAVHYGLRVKNRQGESLTQHSPEEMKSFEEQMEAALKPKLELLLTAFNALDLDHDGRITPRELFAFQPVLDQRARSEAVAAAAAAAEAAAEASGKPLTSPPPPLDPSTVKHEPKLQAIVSLDVDAVFDSLIPPGRGPPSDPSHALAAELREQGLDFQHFVPYLARHAATIAAMAAAAGSKGKKGKKKK